MVSLPVLAGEQEGLQIGDSDGEVREDSRLPVEGRLYSQEHSHSTRNIL
jgi:hypothetical protein